MAERHKGRIEIDIIELLKSIDTQKFLEQLKQMDENNEDLNTIGVSSNSESNIESNISYQQAYIILDKLKKLVMRIRKHQRHTIDTGEFLSIAKTLRDSRKLDNKFYELTENLSVKINGIVIYGIDNMIEAYENGAEKVGKIKYIPSESDLT